MLATGAATCTGRDTATMPDACPTCDNRCPTHPHATMRCPACAGAKGGASTSPRKRRAGKRNAKRATAARLAQRAE